MEDAESCVMRKCITFVVCLALLDDKSRRTEWCNFQHAYNYTYKTLFGKSEWN